MSKRSFVEVDKPATKKQRRESRLRKNVMPKTVTSQQAKVKSDSIRLHLLSCGYIRKYLLSRDINPDDVAQIIAKFLFED